MTEIYFIRHAQADPSVSDQRQRPLTEKGIKDSAALNKLFYGIHIDAVLCSPYKRTVDTVSPLAKEKELTVQAIENFRGLRLESKWIKDYRAFFEAYWADFSYSYSDGESLSELIARNASSLNIILNQYKNNTVVIGTHSVSLAAIINYYDNSFGFEEFLSMADFEPWVVKMIFSGNKYISREVISLPQP